jgi:hypothetical protein
LKPADPIASLVASDAWHRLAGELGSGSTEHLPERLRDLSAQLEAVDVPAEFVVLIRRALSCGNWVPVVDAFGRLGDRDVAFYLGPMRAGEHQELQLGLLLLRRNAAAQRAARAVEAEAGELGARLFGSPLATGGRHTELFDLAAAVGPFEGAGDERIALFTPFYLVDGDVDAETPRRTILFADRVRRRHLSQTRPLLATAVTVADEESIARLDGEQLDEAIGLWLGLHELLHANGPLPLFGASVRKLTLGMSYAAVEELRVDMTAWLALYECEDLFGAGAARARRLIVAERLLRSALSGLADDPRRGALGKSSDAEHGALWFGALLRSGAAFLSEGRLVLDEQHLAVTVKDTLACVYREEARAVESGGTEHLRRFADDLRSELLEESDGGPRYPESVSTFLLDAAHRAHMPIR